MRCFGIVYGRARLVFGQHFTRGQWWYGLTLILEPTHLAPTLMSNLFRFGNTVIVFFVGARRIKNIRRKRIDNDPKYNAGIGETLPK